MVSPPTADDLGGRSVFATITLPRDALVVLIGIAASGKSTFAGRWFAPTAVLSSDQMRAIITDDASAQGATDDAFDLLHRILELRLRRGRLTVVDATNVEDWARIQLLDMARRHRRPAVAIVLDVPLGVALERNALRASPRPPPAALRRQHGWLRSSLPALADEGFAAVHVLSSADEIDATRVEVSTERPT
ncbi:MAG TPA: AAA family ATPase [Candidatus Limnocylindria bacterium]|nr:AAA family ATPase [Candidatus Limnocylindria bacterium]